MCTLEWISLFHGSKISLDFKDNKTITMILDSKLYIIVILLPIKMDCSTIFPENDFSVGR